LHRVALIVAWSVFPLIFIGGLVTSKDAGLSVPDLAQQLRLQYVSLPPSTGSGIFFTSTRTAICVVRGLLTIVLAACAHYRQAPLVRYLGLSCLSMVVLQGVLGGLRVFC